MRPAAFAFAPEFSTRAAEVVAFDRVRITLSRASGIAFDTVIAFPSDADSVRLALSTPINGPSETLTLTLEMIDAAGDTVFRGGPVPVTLEAGGLTTTGGVSVPVRYTGVGANAKSVRIAPATASVFFRDSVGLTAEALDSAGDSIPGAPIAWRSLDTALAHMRSDTSGRVIAGIARGVARIEAALPTGQADTAQVTVQPLPAALHIVSGNAQTGLVGGALAQPLVVKVEAADSLGVAGVAVSFAVAGGGGSVSRAVDTTDATGSASTVWTLGGALGAQTVTAALAASPGVSATFSATGAVGAPKKVAFLVQPSSVAANVAMAPPVQVAVQDTFGNTVTTFGGNVTLAIGTNPGGATLGGTVTVAAVAGVATFGTLTLNLPGTGYTLAASAAGLTGATSNAFDVTGGVPAQLAFVQEPTTTSSGAAITPSVTVQVRDANGNLVPTATAAVTVAIGTNPSGGTLSGTKTLNAVAGVATFPGLSIDNAGSGYTLAASAAGLSGATSAAFTITPGAANSLAVSTQPSTAAQSGVAFAQQPVIQLQDASGNAVSQSGVVVTAAIATGGGTLGGTLTATTNGSGAATFTNLMITGTVGPRTLSFAASGLTGATSGTVTLSAGAATRLAVSTQPSTTAQSGVAFAQQPVLQLQDAAGNPVSQSGVVVTAAIATGGGTLGGTLTAATNGSGAASFTNLLITGTVGARTLSFSASGLAGATSDTITVSAGAASQLAITTQPSAAAQSGVALAPQPVIQLQDAAGNPVSQSGVVVTAAIATGGGTLGGTLTAATNGSGTATFTNLMITGTAGPRTLSFSASGVASVTSGTVVVGAGAPAQLAISAQPSTTAQSGVAFAQQPVLQLQDAAGNPVSQSGVVVTAAIATGGGTLGGTLTASTNGSGAATFTNLMITGTVGARTLSFTASGLTGATSGTVTLSAGAATQLAVSTQPSTTAQSGVAFAQQPAIQLQDASGNAVSQSGVVVTAAITTGGGTLGGTLTATTNGSGAAAFTNLMITGTVGARTLSFAASGLTGATSGTVTLSAGAATQLTVSTQPSTTAQSGVAFVQQPVIQLQDASGNPVSQSGVVVTAAIATGGGTLGGTLTATTNGSGAAAFTNLTMTGTAGARTLSFTASGLTGATSGTVTLSAGAASQLVFTTEPPASATSQAGFGFAVTAEDGGGNPVTTFSGPVTVAIGTNPAGGTLAGTLTVDAAAGVATFTGIAIDNVGSGYTLVASSAGLTSATSGAIAITAPAGVNAWINGAGGNWSVASNWSKGTVPTASDNVTITQSGTYTVNVDANATFATLDVGAPSGTQTLSIAANTLTAGSAAFRPNTVLDLSGTGTITGAGTIADSGAFNWTGGSLGGASGAGGTLRVMPTGTISIAPSANVQLEAYTLELDGSGTWTGSAFINSGNGDTLRVASGATLTVQGAPSFSENLGGTSLLQNDGTIIHNTSASSFVVNVPVSGAGGWQIQTGSINLQLGGTISGAWSVSSGATLNFFASGYTFVFDAASAVTGAGTVNLNSGTVGFAGSYNVTGSTLVGGAAVAFSGPGASTNGLTVSAGTLAVTGALAATGATTWSGGTLDVATGTLSLAGGSGATFAGTATAAPGATLDLAGGTFTQTGNVQVSGALLVGGGTIVPNGHALATTGDFTTSGTGALQETLATDSVDVGGTATFGGGAGTLTAGVLVARGDFVQSTNAAAFAASGTQRTLLNGTGTQNVSFANPTTSFFRELDLPAITHGVVIQTNVQVTDSMTMSGGGGAATLTGAGTSQRLTVGGLLTLQASTATPHLAPPVVELSVTPSIASVSGVFSPDTTVYNGAIATLPTGSGIVYKSVRVNTTGALSAPSGNVTFNGDLIVSSGTYTTGSGIDSVAGFLRTEGTGALSMVSIVASPTVAVGDSAVFAGGPSTTLTGGLLRLYGDFVERGTGGQFAPTGTRVTLQKTAAGAQTIQMADSVNSFFHDLVMNRPSVDTVRLLSNVLAQDSAIVSGSTVLASTAAEALMTPATGVLDVHSGATLRPTRVQFGTFFADSAFEGNARILPDTAVFLNGGSISSSSPAYAWKSVRVAGGSVSSSGTTYNGDLIISGGSYGFCTSNDSVGGFFRTEGSGILALSCQEGEVIAVRDSAVFAGGSETGQLTGGTMKVGGDFVQRGLATSFAADAGHSTIFDGSSAAGQQITFGSPGLTSSHFGFLEDSNSVGPLNLNSNVFTTNSFVNAVTGGGEVSGSASTALTVEGIYLLKSFTFNGAPLVVLDTALETAFAMDTVTFTGYDPTVDQMTVLAATGHSATTYGLIFTTTPTSGHYVSLQWNYTSLLTGTPTLAMLLATPAAQGGTGTVTVGGTQGTPLLSWP